MTLLRAEFDLLGTTDRALQISYQGQRVWLPLSKVSLGEASGALYIPDWLFRARGLYGPARSTARPTARQWHAADAAEDAKRWAKWDGMGDGDAAAYAARVYAGELD